MPLKDRAEKLRKAVRDIDILPATPAIANRVITANLSTEVGRQQLFLLAEQDPQISAKILGLANSARADSGSRIHSVRDASSILGYSKFQTVINGIAIMSLLTKRSIGHFNIHHSWMHSVGVAFAMLGISQSMPKSLRPPDDYTFLAGMIHDIGYLVLAILDQNGYDMLQAQLTSQPTQLAIVIERNLLGITHEELGAELGRHWNLPEDIVTVMGYHHEPDAPEARAGQPLVTMVNIAEKLLPSFGINEYVSPEISSSEWIAIGIEPSQAEEVRKHVSEQTDQANQFASTFS